MTGRAALIPTQNGLAGVETFLIDPPGLGTTLRISISRPVLPAVGGDPDALPAIVYTTDADYHFGTVAEAARVSSYGSITAPAIVVGIGYAEENGDLAFVSARRFLDFYRGPRRGFDAGAYGRFEFGGADIFLAALRDHVIPAVEHHVPAVDPSRRAMLGTSAGGHFAAYAMAEAPDLFRGYALLSPMLIDPQPPVGGLLTPVRGDGELVQLIADLPAGTFKSGLRVFLSVGALEEDPGTMFADFGIISNALRMRNALARHGVVTEFLQFAGEGHAPAAAIAPALRFLVPLLDAKTDWQAALAGNAEN